MPSAGKLLNAFDKQTLKMTKKKKKRAIKTLFLSELQSNCYFITPGFKCYV